MDEFVIIDGNSLINRAYYATPPLKNKDGLYTNAVYAFTNMLLKIIGDINPKYMAVAFDMKAKTFRHIMYEGYKASRKGMPDELAQQLPLLKEVLAAMDITILEREGVEADDIIGTLSKRFPDKTIIITGDRDSLQLIDESTVVYLTKKGLSDIMVVDCETLKREFHLTPEQVIEYKALCGDASDEIPGVNGIGEKTALSLIDKFRSIENIYENIGKIEGKLKDKLIAGRESAFLSKRLATIKTDCDCNFDIDEFVYTYPLSDKVRDVFIKLDFNTLVAKPHLFADSGEAVKEEEKKEIEIVNIDSMEKAVQIAESLKGCGVLSFYFAKNIYVSDGIKEYEIQVSDTFLPDCISFERALNVLKPLLADNRIQKILFDIKNALYILKQYNITIDGGCDDVCLMHYIVNSKNDAYDFIKICTAQGYDKNAPAYAMFSLRDKLLKSMEKDNQTNLYTNIELPLVYVLFDMEQRGFKVDVNAMNELSAKLKGELDALTQKICGLAGEAFNINSPKQLSVILFDKLRLKSGKKTKSGLSTNFDVLEMLSDKHEIIPLILRYRLISKLNGTYIEGIKNLLDKNDVVHTVFRQAQTSTGRLSSIEPNLQNIPVRDEYGKEIRKIFIAEKPGNVLISADYSQIELRLLAHFSGDKRLLSAYNNHEDIHALTASEVFNVSPSKITSDMRRSAKAVNFGIIYGISDYGLSRQLGISPSRAKVYIQKYFETYSSVKQYMANSVEFAKRTGYALTITGRKRYIAELKSPNFNIRSFGERAAMNMPLQGSAADLIKIAMINVYNRLKRESPESKLILQVHDELIVDAPKAGKEAVIKILKEEMENVMRLNVPLEVGIETGYNWYGEQ